MKDLMSYVPKKKVASIELIEKSFDGYEVVLAEGWLHEGNTGSLICPTIADLRHDLKSVEYVGTTEYKNVMGIEESFTVAEDVSEPITETVVATIGVDTTLEHNIKKAESKMDLLLAQNNYLDLLAVLQFSVGGAEKAEKMIADYEDMLEDFIYAGSTFLAGRNEIAVTYSPYLKYGYQVTHFDNNGPDSHVTLKDLLEVFTYLADISAVPMPLKFASYLS